MTLPIRETIEVANCIATHMSPGQAATVIARLRRCSMLEAWGIGLIHGNERLQKSCVETLRVWFDLPDAGLSELINTVNERLVSG